MKTERQQHFDDLAEVLFSALASELANERGIAGVHCVKSFDDMVTRPVVDFAKARVAEWATKYEGTDDGSGD